MNPLKKIFRRQLAVCFLCIYAVSLAPLAMADEAADVTAMIDSADSLRQKAAAVGHEWRYTGKWIKEARAALKSGDINTAKKLAEKAKFESKRALEQSKTSKINWVKAVPK